MTAENYLFENSMNRRLGLCGAARGGISMRVGQALWLHFINWLSWCQLSKFGHPFPRQFDRVVLYPILVSCTKSRPLRSKKAVTGSNQSLCTQILIRRKKERIANYDTKVGDGYEITYSKRGQSAWHVTVHRLTEPNSPIHHLRRYFRRTRSFSFYYSQTCLIRLIYHSSISELLTLW